VAHGDALARLIWRGERLRRSPLGILLRPAAAVVEAAARGAGLLARAGRRLLPGARRARGDAVDLAVEPEWDASLR
jgi:hypothetical protein